MEIIEKKIKALDRAHDIRKFEIDLYWRRTTYFWAFLVTSFGAYFLVLTSKDNGITDLDKNQYLFLIGSIGFIFSLGWLNVNRASKHWQINWEKVIAQLEDEITGPLMGTHITNHNCYWNFASSYRFSVSRINQIISLFIVVIWLILMFKTSITIWTKFDFAICGSWLYPITLFMVIFFTTILSIWGIAEKDDDESKVIKFRNWANKMCFKEESIENITIEKIFPD